MTRRILDHALIAIPNRTTRGRGCSYSKDERLFMRRPWGLPLLTDTRALIARVLGEGDTA
jgi:hypothetical protein